MADLVAAAKSIGVDLLPWQLIVGRYLYAVGPGDAWTFPEVAVVVARQNGKTSLIVPHVMERLAMGRKIIHAAQTRDLPRQTFEKLDILAREAWPDAKIRRGQGQEMIEVPTGGVYRIVAATGGAPRGWSMDDLIMDELRELGEDFVGAAMPTTLASRNPQVLYLSNAGHDESRPLNAVKSRALEDPSLAYLEWSASPDLAADDVTGWAQANPSLGHPAFPSLLKQIEQRYRAAKLAGTLPYFETEHLCRWVRSLAEQLVDDFRWSQCRDEVGKPTRPAIGVAMDPDGRRATIVLAWMEGSRVAIEVIADIHGEPIDTAAVGETIKGLAQKHMARVGYDAHTDGQLAKYVRKGQGENITGQKAAGASAEFARLVGQQRLAYAKADAVTDDLTWTVRRTDGSDGSYQAVHAKDDRPITASLAAIRAVWLASMPKTSGGLRVQ